MAFFVNTKTILIKFIDKNGVKKYVESNKKEYQQQIKIIQNNGGIITAVKQI